MSQFDLAVLGADDPLGEVFLKNLEDREIPVGRLFPLVHGDPEGIQAFRGEEWPWMAAEDFDYSQVQALVVASPLPAYRSVVESLRKARPAMPILTPDQIVPGPAQALARLLRVLSALGKVEHVMASISLPVALAGRAGLDELIHQSRGLFNMESPDPEVFPLQIAFNMIPVLEGGEIRYGPTSLASGVAALTQGLRPGCMVAWMPVLYGGATALQVRMDRPLEIDALRQALRHQEGICLMESDLPAGNPTPATDSLESADIFLGQLSVGEQDIRVWLIYDPLRIESEQMADVVENWIEKPANSVIT
ncbi:MAG: Asd/ArgC dimerization domain-containing protein [Pseudomonadota bacterium]